MPDESSPRLNVHGPELAAANHVSQNLIAATPDRGSLDRSTFLRRAVIGATGVLLGGTLVGCGQAYRAESAVVP